MNCIYCGKTLQEGSVICSRCGKKVQMVKDIDVLEDEYLTGILEKSQQTKTKDNSAETRRRKQEQLRRAKKKRTQMVVSSLFIIALIAIGVMTGFYVRYTIDTRRASSYDYQLMKAEEAYAGGQIKEAVYYYEKALELEPDHRDIRLKLAQLYFDRKDYDSAQLLYLETLQEDPSNLECYRMLIAIYEQKNRTQDILNLCSNVTDPDILALFSDYLVDDPVFSLDSGFYSEYLSLTITSDDGHQIYYTMDGTDPTVYGRLYKESLELNTMGTYTIRAVCVNAKKLYSNVVDETYVIDIPAPDMPVVTPNGGSFEEASTAVISVPDGCTAYYTWNGTTPNTTSDKYKTPIDIPEGNNILSVMIVDDKTGKWSDMYRGRFVYYPPSEEETDDTAEDVE
jgi:uncharacterized Zn finger protein (UPF0148 family)